MDTTSNSAAAMVGERQSGHQDLGRVQARTCVFAVSSDWCVVAVSENCAPVLGAEAAACLGRELRTLLEPRAVHALRTLSQHLTSAAPVVRQTELRLRDGDAIHDVTAIRSGPSVVFEIEAHLRGVVHLAESERIERLYQRLAHQPGLADLAREAARAMRVLSGFDRVTVHRAGRLGLDPALGENGRIGSAAVPDAACLDAHAQAMGAYLHLIDDTLATGVPLHAERGPDGSATPVPNPRVLSSAGIGSELRDTLKRQGVRSAITVPIRRGNAFWGAFVCHHGEVQTPPLAQRSAMSLLSVLLGEELSRLEERTAARTRLKVEDLRTRFLEVFSTGYDLPARLAELAPRLQDIVPHDGLLVLLVELTVIDDD